jgi:hypothetical protein
MFSKLTLVTAVAGVALLVAVPAWGKVTPQMSPDTADAVAQSSASEQWQQALQARGEGMNRQYGLGDTTQGTASRISYEQALTARGQELNRQYGLGGSTPTSTYIDAHERAARVAGIEPTTPIVPDAIERAVASRSFEPKDGFLSGDDHIRLDPADLPTTVPVSSPSGREVEWPQVGVGLGLGVLLMLGIGLTMRLTRVRRLAH